MRVRILSTATDEFRTYEGGEVCEFADDKAERWIRAGIAEADAPEAATLCDQVERATLPRAKKRSE